jgi:hypothetical protein
VGGAWRAALGHSPRLPVKGVETKPTDVPFHSVLRVGPGPGVGGATGRAEGAERTFHSAPSPRKPRSGRGSSPDARSEWNGRSIPLHPPRKPRSKRGRHHPTREVSGTEVPFRSPLTQTQARAWETPPDARSERNGRSIPLVPPRKTRSGRKRCHPRERRLERKFLSAPGVPRLRSACGGRRGSRPARGSGNGCSIPHRTSSRARRGAARGLHILALPRPA